MGAEVGKKALIKSQGEYAKVSECLEAKSGYGKAATDDADLDEKRHDRAFNPIDQAEKGSVSAKLNADSGRYRKGPGPV
jgi:hypothetical protein